MANRNKNVKQRTQNWADAAGAFDDLPEIEKIRYVNKRRKQRSNKHEHCNRSHGH